MRPQFAFRTSAMRSAAAVLAEGPPSGWPNRPIAPRGAHFLSSAPGSACSPLRILLRYPTRPSAGPRPRVARPGRERTSISRNQPAMPPTACPASRFVAISRRATRPTGTHGRPAGGDRRPSGASRRVPSWRRRSRFSSNQVGDRLPLPGARANRSARPSTICSAVGSDHEVEPISSGGLSDVGESGGTYGYAHLRTRTCRLSRPVGSSRAASTKRATKGHVPRSPVRRRCESRGISEGNWFAHLDDFRNLADREAA